MCQDLETGAPLYLSLCEYGVRRFVNLPLGIRQMDVELTTVNPKDRQAVPFSVNKRGFIRIDGKPVDDLLRNPREILYAAKKGWLTFYYYQEAK